MQSKIESPAGSQRLLSVDALRGFDIFVGGLVKWMGPWAGFVESSAALAIIWLALYWMYRKSIFIKI